LYFSPIASHSLPWRERKRRPTGILAEQVRL
jgi:hypothetical protein